MSAAAAVPPMPAPAPVLEVASLSIDFRTREGTVRALENVSLRMGAGEFVGVVGESGSGKSVMAYAITGLLDRAGRVTQGRALFGGRDLLALSERARRASRGRDIAMIFQSPRTSLNPIRTVGNQLADVLRRRHGLDRRAARERSLSLLTQVRITDPEKRLDAYPFAMSGGMCQRVLIALALACEPTVLIADEPTTGLDVTTQASIMELLKDLARRRGMAVLFITHDLTLAAECCDRIVVMHAGHVVEEAPTAVLFRRPRHPYTARLIAAVPARAARLTDLAAIPGSLPDLRGALPPCRYSQRCERAQEACERGPLPIVDIGPGHRVACCNPLEARA
ncbi:MAG TPA: ABC transporter ATP-binding protein [Polyangia bacterium]|nr:ABC transporter ATP-binding protein [Polyangia bacterium]